MNWGEDWTQKKVSLLESKETVDEELIEQVAKVLKVPKEAIENMTDETAISIISSNFHDYSSINNNSTLTFNPLDKYVEAIEKNVDLYERLLKAEKEKNELLQKILEENRK